MKFVSVLAAIAIVNAQEEGEEAAATTEPAAKLGTGEACTKETAGNCDAGLCCAEGVFKEDVVDGEVAENYMDNVISVCNGEKESEYENDDGEAYWMTCMEIASGAAYLATVATSVATAAYITL